LGKPDSNFKNRGENKKDQENQTFLICNMLWLGVSFWNITIAKENEADVKEIRSLLDEDSKEEEQVC